MSALKKLKFWGKDPENKPELPQDVKDFQATRPYNGVQPGYVKEKASVNGVAIAATIVVVFFAGVLLYLYFWVFLLHT